MMATSWGFYGHRTVNRLAIYTLPQEMMGFYKSNADYLTDHSVDPDKRRYSSPEESPRHYLDADYYEQVLPLDSIPFYWKDAVAKYTEDTLNAYGIGPWHLEKMVYRLQKAFEEKNTEAILRLSAEVGHYAADLHVPLHTSMNYNGQLTGQEGIHGFWESRLPELFAGDYDLYVGPALYIERIQPAIWEVFSASVAARDSVLRLEKELSLSFPEEKKYAFEEKGNGLVKVYSEEYSRAYHELLNGMVERRMRAALHFIGSLWYTAWVNAGSPALAAPMALPATDSLKQEIVREKEGERKRMLIRDEGE